MTSSGVMGLPERAAASPGRRMAAPAGRRESAGHLLRLDGHRLKERPAEGGGHRHVALTGGAPPPFHQEQGGVVGGEAASCRRQGTGETARRLLDALADLAGAFQEVDQALNAELLPARLVFLEGAVGEEQHPVAAPELVLADDWRGPAEADRESSG